MTDIPNARWALGDWDAATPAIKLRASGCALCKALHGGTPCSECAGP